jgi:plastocyanin
MVDTKKSARRSMAVALAVVIGVGLMALLPLGAGSGPERQEIVLVARGMAFYVEGTHVPNPVLRVRPGSEVHLVLRNEDAGLTHDLRIDGLGVAVGPLEGLGRAAVTFRAPEESGRFEYVCTPHAAMMRGVVEVH